MANYRGAKDVEFIWNGTQSDPQLRYKDMLFNYYDIEEALWDMFEEENPQLDLSGEWADTQIVVEQMFDEYVQDNVVNYLEDCIYGGYFN